MKKIYLAGPDVFLPDSIEQGKRKKELCNKYGFEGLYPLDNEIEETFDCKADMGLHISQANEQLIQQCDAVIANLTPFRGTSADVGTVYEIGLAKGLDKLVLGYTNDGRNFLQRNLEDLECVNQQANDSYTDQDDMFLEDFDLVDNLMIDGGVHYPIIKKEVYQSGEKFRDLEAFEACLMHLAKCG